MRHIKRIGLIGFLVGLTHLTSAQNSAELREATQPLTDGVPEVAVMRLQNLLNKDLSNEERSAASWKLAEALLAAEQPADALNLLQDPELRDTSGGKFWRAQALAMLGRPGEALPLYEQLGADQTAPFHSEAIFGAGEMLRALGRNDEALKRFMELFHNGQWNMRARLRAAEVYLDRSDVPNASRLLEKLKPQSPAERKERHFLRGRIEMARRRPERAIPIFESLLMKPKGATHPILLAALFGIADAYLDLKTPERGDDLLEDFIEHHPQDAGLAQIFAKLDELYRAERKPGRGQLERWAHDPAQPRRAFALWYLARHELHAGHRERALKSFAELRASPVKFAALAPAFLEFARLELEDRRYDEALGILTDARALKPDPAVLDRISLLAAQAEYRAKRFPSATAGFEQVAHSSSALATLSTFNAAVGWLQQENHVRFVADYQEFVRKGGDKESQAELRLEEGLLQAANGDQKAANSLQEFLRDFPGNRRASEARVALAELAFHASPPRLDEARQYLAKALTPTADPTPTAQERGDYLAIWIEDATNANGDKVIQLAKRFLRNHRGSALIPAAQMKLAEVYYRRQDFANAQTQFEILAEQDPTGPLAEKALFFAAKSAGSSMGAHSLEQAIVLFDKVVHLNGALKWAARNEQAVIERKLGKPQDALALYDEVLKGDAQPAEKREALCGTGDIFFEMGLNDPKNYQRAIASYDQLTEADRDGTAHWRNQALFKKGECLEKEAKRPEALAAFYQVLENEQQTSRPHELFWFYKAGFSAGRLLEDDAKWQSAVAVYQKLAAAGGARSEEAKRRLERLRLEHFLWEE
jgi:thioredoxin-like negative regulator of GroEL/TolA-binding protein